MVGYPPAASTFESGLEVNREDEGLQWRTGVIAKQPVLQYRYQSDAQYKAQSGAQSKVELDNSSYRQLGSDGNRHATYGNPQRRNPWGLGPLMFGLLVAVVTAIIIGSAVGGGMASAINTSHASSSAATTTITTSIYQTVGATATNSAAPSSTATTNIKDYIIALPQDVNTVELDCPSITSYKTENLDPNQIYDVSCGIDYANSISAVQGGVVGDIVGIVAYSAQDCMQACSYMNQFNTQWGYGTICAGISFSQDMSLLYAEHGGNCWLKNGTASSPRTCTDCLSAAVAS